MPRSQAGPRRSCVAFCRCSEAMWYTKLFRSSVLKCFNLRSPILTFLSVVLPTPQRMGQFNVTCGRRRAQVGKNIDQAELTLAPCQVNTVIRNGQLYCIAPQ